jgi:hypothetical protein
MSNLPAPLSPLAMLYARYPESPPPFAPAWRHADFWISVHCECDAQYLFPVSNLIEKRGPNVELACLGSRLRCRECGGRNAGPVIVGRSTSAGAAEG